MCVHSMRWPARSINAKAIANLARKTTFEEHLNDPVHGDPISPVLEEIIKPRKASALSYET